MPKKQLNMDKVAQLLSDGSTALRKVASERDEVKAENGQLKEANAALVRRMEAEKVAADMHSKGIRTEVPFDALSEALEKEAEQGKLTLIKEALDMTGPDMMRDSFVREDSPAGGGASEFEAFINGEVG
jgi:hypothetical protein